MPEIKNKELLIINRQELSKPAGTVLFIINPDSDDELNMNLIINAERMTTSGLSLVVCSPTVENIKKVIEEQKDEKVTGVISGNDLPEEVRVFLSELKLPVQVFKA